MKSLEELIHREEPGWDMVGEWIRTAKNPVEVLPKDDHRASQELVNMQVTTRSPMGAIIYESGGILVDHGWLRILGSGHARLDRGVFAWNQGKTIHKLGQPPSHLLIADDLLGGYFAVNAGGLGSKMGKVHYLPQDRLEWECLDTTYSEFVYWAFHGDLDKFYQGFRWKTWQQDAKAASGHQVFSFYPFLWSKEGGEIEKCHRELVPIEEHYRLTMEFRKKLAASGSE